jgi:outer membrane protein, heavy metal efflux system
MPLFHPLLLMMTVTSGPSEPCSGPLTRAAVVDCAAASSPRLVAARASVDAARGLSDAARVILPSNPTVSVTVGQRWNTNDDRALNVAGTLSQRLEISGQRRQRKDAADALVARREGGLEASTRDVIARALLAYYDVLAARAELLVISQGHATALQMQEVASARATAGLGMPLDTDLAAAEVAALQEQQALATGAVRAAEARLASALGLDPAGSLPDVIGELTPVAVPGGLTAATLGATTRPELAERQAQTEQVQAELSLLKRGRIPSPALSLFAQTDGFNERVIGGGLSMPIPLPFPLGRTNKGEIDGARARIDESNARLASAQRRVTLEATAAFHDYEAHKSAANAYRPDAEASARASLGTLASEIERGTLPVRDALLTQQALLRMLLRAVESKHGMCQAAVALALAAGHPLQEGAP